MPNHQPEYLLDANVFIEASRRYYAFDICPGFWELLKTYQEHGQIYSIKPVYEELQQGKDALAEWAKTTITKEGFRSIEREEMLHARARIASWVQANNQFTQAAKKEFESRADSWLVAYAMAHKVTLVTHEVYNPDRKNRIKIPNVCKAFDVKYLDTFEMLRTLGARFQWRGN